MSEKDAIAKRGESQVPAELKDFTDAAGYQQLIDEAREGLGETLPRIKVMTGGACMFQSPSDETSKEMDGVILLRHRARAFWPPGTDKSTNSPPTCHSQDGVLGSLTRTPDGAFGDCQSCRWAKFGTAVDDAGTPGKGQACRLTDQLHLMLDGQDTPFVLTATPTSLKEVKEYMVKILTATPRRLPFQVLTRFSLEKRGAGQMLWSTLKITKVRDLKQDEVERAWAMRLKYLPVMEAQVVSAADVVH